LYGGEYGTVAALSRASEVSGSTIYSDLRGQADSFKGSTEQKIADKCKTTVAHIFNDPVETDTPRPTVTARSCSVEENELLTILRALDDVARRFAIEQLRALATFAATR
jgi:hypothetical protein